MCSHRFALSGSSLMLFRLRAPGADGVSRGYIGVVYGGTLRKMGAHLATNDEIADQFDEIAARMYLAGESWFKIAAYRRAAATFRGSEDEVRQLAKEERLRELRGVGKEIALKTEAYLATGHIPLLDRLRALQPQIPDTTQATLELNKPRTGTSRPASRPPRRSPNTGQPREAADQTADSRTWRGRRD